MKTCSVSPGGLGNKPKPGENIEYKVVLGFSYLFYQMRSFILQLAKFQFDTKIHVNRPIFTYTELCFTLKHILNFKHIKSMTYNASVHTNSKDYIIIFS